MKAITGITAPTGKTFLYWSLNADGSGKKYYPNNTIEIEGDITLYAIWGDTTTTLSLIHIYHDGYNTDTTDSVLPVAIYPEINVSYEKVNANASPAIFFDTYGHAIVPVSYTHLIPYNWD